MVAWPAQDWLTVLDRLTDADLDRTASFPWQNNPERTLAHTASWVNSELMKNTAEIGQLHFRGGIEKILAEDGCVLSAPPHESDADNRL